MSTSKPPALDSLQLAAKDLQLHGHVIRLRESNTIVWARMTGFAPWPARFCSKPEEIEILKGPKARFAPVVFLGLGLTQGWVGDGNIVPFDNETMSKKEFFSQKKFDTDKDYRASIIEAVRQCMQRGIIFSPEVIHLISTDATYVWERTDVCTKCKGTELCGVSLMCDLCDVNETHLHCLVNPRVNIPPGKWYCDECCIKTGLPIGTLLPDSEDEASAGSDVNNDGEIGGARKKVKFGKDAKEKKARGRPKAQPKNNIYGTVLSESITNFISKEDNGAGSDERNENEIYFCLHPSVKEDDVCFVCDEGGKLLLCDYPLCIRSYHHACVIKSFPHSPDYSFQDDNDVWFCPKHTCSMCSVMEIMPHTVYSRTVQLPKSMMVNLSCSKSGYIATYDLVPQKELKSCTNCPFSACKECEVKLAPTVGVDASLFKFKRNLLGEKVLNCLNCYSLSTNYRLKIAKLLEATWSKIVTSRLALPFIRPLLPGVHAADAGNGGSLDLMSILENIRSFKYESTDVFTNDLGALRELIFSILKNIAPGTCNDNQSIIINSYDTVVSNALQFLDRKKKSIIQSISSDLESQGDVMDTKLDTTQAYALMNYWRCECDGNKEGSVMITPRSIESWEMFLSHGQLLKHNKGKVDPYAIPLYWADSNLSNRVVHGSQNKPSAFLEKFDEYVVDNSDGVVEAMLQLSACQSAAVGDRTDTPDIYKLLAKLRQLAAESLHITDVIRSKYTQEKFNLIDVDQVNGLNSKFELGMNKTLLQELKLVNDNLLWRLSTTNKSYEASKVVISDYVDKIRSNESRLIAISDERLKLAKQAHDCSAEITKLGR